MGDLCKRCPGCARENPPQAFECSECGYDLFEVPLTDAKPVIKQPLTQPINGRRCPDCGQISAVNIRICPRCGADLAGAELVVDIPTESAAAPVKMTSAPAAIRAVAPSVTETESVLYSLRSIDALAQISIPKEGLLLGANGALSEYLSPKSYVSGTHAWLFYREGKLVLQNLSRTNGTLVNFKTISGDTELKAGDMVSLGGREGAEMQNLAAYFIVTAEQKG